MKILLDTHYILWALEAIDKLTQEEMDLILDANNEIYYSDISLWEIAIKHEKKPEAFGPTANIVAELCEEAGYHELYLKKSHVETLSSLKLENENLDHKDPFDKLLLAQAKAEEFKFLTRDSKLKLYKETCII